MISENIENIKTTFKKGSLDIGLTTLKGKSKK